MRKHKSKAIERRAIHKMNGMEVGAVEKNELGGTSRSACVCVCERDANRLLLVHISYLVILSLPLSFFSSVFLSLAYVVCTRF